VRKNSIDPNYTLFHLSGTKNHALHSTPQNLQVLFEDNHLIVVNKRAGDLVQGDKTADRPLSEIVKDYIKKRYEKPGAVYLGVTHRLDRPTTGVVVFARTAKALARMNAIFKEKQAVKTYWAIVGKPPEKTAATLHHYLVRNPRQNKSYAFAEQQKESKKAELDYVVKKKLDRYYLLEILLKTGRHHQIRAQLAAIGCPIKGDLKYGFPRSNTDGSIHLHARSLSFIHPVSLRELHLVAPPPADAVWEACL
jgi:23S rRNA pseudouridine1911/1915/1917 synthase